MTIKPLAAGRLLPVVGLAFVWNTIRDQDMVTIGSTTPDEAREVIEISLDLLNRRIPDNELQKTRSKRSFELEANGHLHHSHSDQGEPRCNLILHSTQICRSRWATRSSARELLDRFNAQLNFAHQLRQAHPHQAAEWQARILEAGRTGAGRPAGAQRRTWRRWWRRERLTLQPIGQRRQGLHAAVRQPRAH